jgi:hypothetical protein
MHDGYGTLDLCTVGVKRPVLLLLLQRSRSLPPLPRSLLLLLLLRSRSAAVASSSTISYGMRVYGIFCSWHGVDGNVWWCTVVLMVFYPIYDTISFGIFW